MTIATATTVVIACDAEVRPACTAQHPETPHPRRLHQRPTPALASPH